MMALQGYPGPAVVAGPGRTGRAYMQLQSMRHTTEGVWKTCVEDILYRMWLSAAMTLIE